MKWFKNFETKKQLREYIGRIEELSSENIKVSAEICERSRKLLVDHQELLKQYQNLREDYSKVKMQLNAVWQRSKAVEAQTKPACEYVLKEETDRILSKAKESFEVLL